MGSFCTCKKYDILHIDVKKEDCKIVLLFYIIFLSDKREKKD